jgi:hypothetical protein
MTKEKPKSLFEPDKEPCGAAATCIHLGDNCSSTGEPA